MIGGYADGNTGGRTRGQRIACVRAATPAF